MSATEAIFPREHVSASNSHVMGNKKMGENKKWEPKKKPAAGEACRGGG